jgi:hypothetical protein
MELRDLVFAILAGDLLTARQCVADARRERVKWGSVQCPRDFAGREMTVAAGVVELLADRAGERPPPWTHAVGAEREAVVLDPGLEQMPRSFEQAKAFGPEPLRKRNLIALPDFLDVA